MPARSKKRNKFDFQDRKFLWHIDNNDTWIRICSLDKSFIVATMIYQPDFDNSSPMLLEVIGKEFPASATKDRPLNIVLPEDVFSKIQSSMGAYVNAILNWSFDPTTHIQLHSGFESSHN